MFKISKLAMSTLTLLTIFPYIVPSTSAESIDSTKITQPYSSEIITAKGKVEGALTQYISGLPFTGNITLHYTATNTGFVIGNTSILTIKLPEEFESVSSLPEFKEKITGNLHLQTIIGQKPIAISPEMVDSYPDRLIIHAPPSFWSGTGQFSADLTINFGEFLEENPELNIPDASEGYEFITQLQYSPNIWDFTNYKIIGTSEDTYISKETSVIYNSSSLKGLGIDI